MNKYLIVGFNNYDQYNIHVDMDSPQWGMYPERDETRLNVLYVFMWSSWTSKSHSLLVRS
jgi:hypothetical protein